MNALITDAILIQPGHKLHNTKVCIRVENGIISAVAKKLDSKKGETNIKEKNLHVSTGWFDSSASMGEPGYEERETLANGLQVAAKSGFTGVAVQPNTQPVTDNSGAVAFLLNKSSQHAVDLFPIGALTSKMDGIDLAELYDMQQAGATAFGDYQKGIKNPNLLKLALQYAQGFDGLVLSFPLETDVMGNGQVNEGIAATNLGLKGIPTLSESLQIARDLHILEYTGGKLHIPTISAEASVALIKAAKKKGLDVTCSVAITNLFYTEETLHGFDTRYKLLPPLRTEADRQALIAGLKDGTIDMVCSDHNPIDIEHKKLEFDHALFGTTAEEITFKALLTVVDVELAVKLLTSGRKRFGDKSTEIVIGAPANLSLFRTDGKSVFTKNDILSKSKNAAFLDEELPGNIYGIIANDQFIKA